MVNFNYFRMFSSETGTCFPVSTYSLIIFLQEMTESKTDAGSHHLIQTGEENWCNKMTNAWFHSVLCPRRPRPQWLRVQAETLTVGIGIRLHHSIAGCTFHEMTWSFCASVSSPAEWVQSKCLAGWLWQLDEIILVSVEVSGLCSPLMSFVTHLLPYLPLLFNCCERKLEGWTEYSKMNAQQSFLISRVQQVEISLQC